MKKLFNTMFGVLALVGVSTSFAMAAETNSTYGVPASQNLNASEEFNIDNFIVKDNKEWDSTNPDSPPLELWDYSNPDNPQFISYLLHSEVNGDGYFTFKDNKEWDPTNPDSPPFELWDYSNPDNPKFISYLLYSEVNGDGYFTLSEIKEIDFDELNEFLNSAGLSFKIEIRDFSDVQNIRLISTEKYNEFNFDNFDKNDEENLRFSIVASEKY